VDRLQQPAGAGEHDIGQHERQTEYVRPRYNIGTYGSEDHGSAVDV
jgi:hypothetical protein